MLDSLKVQRGDYVKDPSLVLDLPLYRLDGQKFTSVDKYGHLCTVTGALWRPNGRYFDGNNDAIDCGANVSLFNFKAITVEAWAKAGELTGTDSRVIWGLVKDTENRIYLTNPTSGATSSLLLGRVNNVAFEQEMHGVVDLSWHHFVCSMVGTQYSSFYDGGFVRTETEPDLANFVGQPTFFIGRHLTNNFLNLIGEVRIYSRGLSPLESQRNYLATKWRYK